MAIVSLSRAQLAFGHVALLDSTDFSIDAGERVALIGRNGSGKSSLLRVISGTQRLDDGLLQRATRLVTAYVPQEPALDDAHTVFEAVGAGLSEQAASIAEYDQISLLLADAKDPAPLLERMQELQSVLDSTGAWSFKARVEKVLTRLNLDPLARIGSLSGGTRKRVALAHALVTEPDLLLLDEPTNHLDVSSIRWLEGLLIGFQGAVILVTHDRRFLDRVATRVVELDRGQLRSYPGSFAAYQARKREELEAEQTANEKFDRLLAQEEVWIRKGIEARRTRNEGRVRRLESLRRERAARRDQAGNVQIAVGTGERSGKIVAELVNVSKAFGDKVIVHDFSATIMRGDKVGLIGANGAGKTTLLRLILGELQPDSGTVRLGTNLAIAYFDQMRAQLDETASLVDTISPGSEWVEVDGKKRHTMTYLADFLFPPERARSPVSTLSGGERNRLLLARLFARPANVLVLDEPTNDLDIETLELLEELMETYTGTIFLVSHDRAFLDNVVTQTIAAEGEGAWREYAGGYEAYEAALERSEALAAPAKRRTEALRSAGPAAAPLSAPTAAKSRLSYKEQRELESLPARIAALEGEQATITAQLADSGLYRTDPVRVKSLNERFASIDGSLLEYMERWENLETRSKGT